MVRYLLVAYLAASASAQPLDIVQAVRQGKVQLQASGDGKSCRKVQLLLTNPAKQSIEVFIPRFTVLDHASQQDLLLLEEKRVNLPANGQARSTCQSMCCGQRQEAPPGAATSYQPAPCSGHPGAEQARKCYESSVKLCKDNAFPQLPIAPSQIPGVIAQLAFWKGNGSLTKEEFEQVAGRDLQMTPQSKPEEQKEFHQGVNNVWDSVDLTAKESAK